MKIEARQWIMWIAATATAAVSLVAYAYTNFVTKEEADRANVSIEKRLDRIENKQDQMLIIMKN